MAANCLSAASQEATEIFLETLVSGANFLLESQWDQVMTSCVALHKELVMAEVENVGER